MNQPIDGGYGHHFIREDAIPFREGLVGCDDEAAGLISMGDELKQDICLLVTLFDITKIIQDEHTVFIEFLECIFELELFTGLLQLLHQGRGGVVTYPYALLGKAMTDSCGQMGLANTAGAEQQQVAGLVNPVCAGGEDLYLFGLEFWHLGKVEAG